MVTVGDTVLRLFDRKEGYIAGEIGGVVEEDNYGAMPTSTPAMVWVTWDDAPGFPEHISRARLVKIGSFSIRPIADDHSDEDLSQTFPSRKEASVYRAEILSDSSDTHYSIVPLDEQGNAL